MAEGNQSCYTKCTTCLQVNGVHVHIYCLKWLFRKQPKAQLCLHPSVSIFFYRILNNLADETLVSIHFRYVIIRSWFTRQSVGGANSPVGKKTEEEGATRWRQSKRKWWKMMQQTGCTVVQTFVMSWSEFNVCYVRTFSKKQFLTPIVTTQ